MLDISTHYGQIFQQQINKVRRRGIIMLFIIINLGFYTLLSLIQLIVIIKYLPLLLVNLVEFYESYIPRSFILFAGFVSLSLSILIIHNLYYLFIYKLNHPFFQQYRVNPVLKQSNILQKPWPWEKNINQWKQLLNKTFQNSNKTTLFIALPFFITQSLIMENIKIFQFQISKQTLPDAKTMILQILFFLLVQDFLFYVVHRSLHHPKLYWIHKRHHQYTHSITVASTYSHPIQYIFAGLIPWTISYKILSLYYPVHLTTILVWIFLRFVETTQSHSGYEWPWSIYSVFPFGAGPKYHDFHHSHNEGNFGSFFIFWDTINKTNVQYFKFIFKNN